MHIISNKEYIKLLQTQNLIKETIAAVLRIQQYLRDVEIRCVKTHKLMGRTYWQQRGKLTSYLYFLETLGENWIVEQIGKERGMKLIDAKAGIIKERLKYLDKFKKK